MDPSDLTAWTTHEWANQTTLHPVGLAVVAVCSLVTLLVDRRWAILPIFVVACFVAPAQRVVVASIDFDLLRILVLVGWLRVVLWREYANFRVRGIDILMVVGAAATVIASVNRTSSTSMLIAALGNAFDACGMYFLFRVLIRDLVDLEHVALGFAAVSIPVAAVFFVERTTGRNLFAFFGGVPEFTVWRAGRLRCQGAFAHPILAGTFWAALLPLIATLWWGASGFRKAMALVGSAMALGIVIMCSSSTPIMVVVAGGIGAGLYRIRYHMYYVWGAAIASLTAIHFLMEKPVWHLMARVNMVGGSTGWHRYKVLDDFIGHFDEWWLSGTDSASSWGWGAVYDITNQYVLVGVRGGLAALIMFLLVLICSFGAIGRTVQVIRDQPRRTGVLWAVGIMLFMHAVAFLGVTYFGQIKMVWALTIAAAVSLTNVPRPMVIGRTHVRPGGGKRPRPPAEPGSTGRPGVA